jgi:hypothetical protein
MSIGNKGYHVIWSPNVKLRGSNGDMAFAKGTFNEKKQVISKTAIPLLSTQAIR